MNARLKYAGRNHVPPPVRGPQIWSVSIHGKTLVPDPLADKWGDGENIHETMERAGFTWMTEFGKERGPCRLIVWEGEDDTYLTEIQLGDSDRFMKCEDLPSLLAVLERLAPALQLENDDR